MALEWTRAVRPLVVVFALVAFLVTWVFEADVDKQSGAYATGVLVLTTSASIAVTISERRRRKTPATIGFGLIAAVFVYTTVVSIIVRPDGVWIAGAFIIGSEAAAFLARRAWLRGAPRMSTCWAPGCVLRDENTGQGTTAPH